MKILIRLLVAKLEATILLVSIILMFFGKRILSFFSACDFTEYDAALKANIKVQTVEPPTLSTFCSLQHDISQAAFIVFIFASIFGAIYYIVTAKYHSHLPLKQRIWFMASVTPFMCILFWIIFVIASIAFMNLM